MVAVLAMTFPAWWPYQQPTRQRRYKIAPSTRAEVLARGRHRCAYCGSTRKLTMDHIVPRSKGGKSHAENLQVLCKSCNNQKADS